MKGRVGTAVACVGLSSAMGTIAACSSIAGLDGYYIDPCLAAGACPDVEAGVESAAPDASVAEAAGTDASVAEAASTEASADALVDVASSDGSPPESGDDVSAPTEAGDAPAGCPPLMPTRCGSSCIDTSSDPANCGTCGHDCLGVACNAGMCQPTTLATGQMDANSVVVDGTNVYWTDYSPNFGTVKQCALSDCMNTIVTLATNQIQPMYIAVDPANVYWMNLGAGSIVKCAIGGCSNRPTLLTGVTGIADFAKDLTTVYFTSSANGTIARCPLTGCGGGEAPVTMASGQSMPDQVLIVGTSMYWADDGDSTIERCDISNCSGSIVSIATGQARVSALASDSSRIYWASSELQGTVSYCPIGSICGGSPTLIASMQNNPSSVAVDAVNVYWANQGDGTIKKCAVGGCAVPITVAAGQSNPRAVALDSAYVYWASWNNATVVRAPK